MDRYDLINRSFMARGQRPAVAELARHDGSGGISLASDVLIWGLDPRLTVSIGVGAWKYVPNAENSDLDLAIGAIGAELPTWPSTSTWTARPVTRTRDGRVATGAIIADWSARTLPDQCEISSPVDGVKISLALSGNVGDIAAAQFGLFCYATPNVPSICPAELKALLETMQIVLPPSTLLQMTTGFE